MLLGTSILERVSAEAASRADRQRAGRADPAVAGAGERVCPADRGRVVPLPHAVRRGAAAQAEARASGPDRPLHRRAARWYERNGRLTDAVRHAAQAGDWQLAAGLVVDGLAISEIIEPRAGQSLAREFASMPHGRPGPGRSPTWSGPLPSCPLASLNPVPPRSRPPKACLGAFRPTRRPRPGWPQR